MYAYTSDKLCVVENRSVLSVAKKTTYMMMLCLLSGTIRDSLKRVQPSSQHIAAQAAICPYTFASGTSMSMFPQI
jgi:hypothetical protein